MFRVRQKQDVVAEVVREKPIEPRAERPLALRIEQLEERIAPATNLNLSRSNIY